MDVPLDTIKRRLEKRDGPDSPLLKDIERFKSEFENCRSQIPADITVGEDYDYDNVFDRVRQLAGLDKIN